MKDETDRLLRKWAALHRPDETRRSSLEDRVLQAFRDGWRGPTLPVHRAWLHALIGFAAGIAAALVVVFLPRRGSEAHDSLRTLLMEERGLFAERRPAAARVFGETERLFGSNLQWVAQSGRDVELGVSDETSSGSPLIVRVTLVARRNGSDEWRRIWKTEVVARTDDVLEVPSLGGTRNHVAIWMHRLDGGSALVESRLTLQEPLGLAAEASEVLRFGATRSVSQFRHGDTEYRILQTVAPIGGVACSS